MKAASPILGLAEEAVFMKAASLILGLAECGTYVGSNADTRDGSVWPNN